MEVSLDERLDVAPAPWSPFLAVVSRLALVGALGLAVTAYVALRTSLGLRLDPKVMDAVSSSAEEQFGLHVALRSSTHWAIAALVLVCALLTLVRHRLDLALGAAVAVGGAYLTTDFLQHELFTRPGLDPEMNGLPSQHATVALSLALAAVIVAPSAWRSIVATGVSAAAGLVGVALVLGRWHRPSDVIAAAFVCLFWAAVGLLAAAVVRRRGPAIERSPAVHLWALAGASVGALLVSWGVRPQSGLDDLGLGLVAIGAVGLTFALSVGAVSRIAARHLD